VYLDELPTDGAEEIEPEQTVYGTGTVRNPDQFLDRALAVDGAVTQAAS
jgi:hypothetical protein